MNFDERLSDLQNKAEDYESKIQALFDSAEEAERGLGPEELTQVDELEAKIAENSDAQDSVKREQEAKLRSEKRKAERERGTGRKTAPNNVRVTKNEEDKLDDDPKFGFRSRLDFLHNVMDAAYNSDNGVYVGSDPRLKKLMATAGSDEHQTKSDGYGGFLVPEEFRPDLLKIDPEGDPVAGRTTNIPMNSTSVKIPYRVDKNHSTSVSGGLTVARRMETVAATSSRMTLGQVKLETNSLFGVSFASEELLVDSAISFAAVISAGFSDEFNKAIMQERLNGTGAGEYLGIYNSDALLAIAKESGQAADTINYTNVLKMKSRCYGYDKAIWLANHDTQPQLGLLNDGYNGVYWNSAEDDKPDRLLGRPIFYTEHVPTLGDQGDLTLANWGEYLEGTYQPLQRAESMHVRFLEHERTFKFWLRNAGSPWWDSVLTPINGATRSPFVVLAERA